MPYELRDPTHITTHRSPTNHSSVKPKPSIEDSLHTLKKKEFVPNGDTPYEPDSQTIVWTSYLRNEYRLLNASEHMALNNNNPIIKEMLRMA